MDKSVKPGDNFFQYVNGTWLNNTEIPSREEAAALMGDPEMGLRAPVGGWVDVDVKDIENYIFYMSQSGLGMPNRNYYFDEGEKSDALRAAYVDYLEAMLNKMTKAELKDYAKGFPWDAMLETSGLASENTFILRQNDAIQGLAKTFGETDLDVLRDYMSANYLGSMAAYLPSEVDDARFAFYGTALRGTTEQRKRWERAVGQIDGYMGQCVAI